MNPPIVVGAGLSGLACARALEAAGLQPVVLEASDRIGGKQRTDVIDGYRIDRGFQVHFSAYPTARRLLGDNPPDWGRFEPGCAVWTGDSTHTIHRDRPLQAALSPLMPLSDKLRILSMRRQLRQASLEEIWNSEDQSALDELRQAGFGSAFFRNFARPFFGGIFLSTDLSVSSQMFRYVWKMLNEGETVLPHEGIGAIPRAIAAPLRAEVRLSSRVSELTDDGVRLESGETIVGPVVLATDPAVAGELVGRPFGLRCRTSTSVAFEALHPPINEPMLVVNASGRGIVNHVAPLNLVCPSLAPQGKHLVSATVLGDAPKKDRDLAGAVRVELADWFPKIDVGRWQPLVVHRVACAQWEQPPGFRDRRPDVRPRTNVYLAGDYMEHSSIEGALVSGERAAAALMEDLG